MAGMLIKLFKKLEHQELLWIIQILYFKNNGCELQMKDIELAQFSTIAKKLLRNDDILIINKMA